MRARGLLYVACFALFVSISHAQLRFHPPRADRPERVFGGKFVFLTVQTNVVITAYVGLCVLELVLPWSRARCALARTLHVLSSSVFALGFLMGAGYYALVHFDVNTRQRAAEIDGFDFYMHLLHGFPLAFVLVDTLFKDHTFMQTAPESIVQALASLTDTLYYSSSASALADDPLLAEQQVALAAATAAVAASVAITETSKTSVSMSVRRHQLLLRKRMRRAALRVRRSLAVKLRQGDTYMSVLYGVFYLSWSVLCARMNNGWWPYPFQQTLRPSILAALYTMFIVVLLPTLTLTARALRGRATQATRAVAGRSRGFLASRKRSTFKRTGPRVLPFSFRRAGHAAETSATRFEETCKRSAKRERVAQSVEASLCASLA
mmetsp:Transcript_7412/g.19760  ORF Transcript_7412/g.19760 Transcript_7412/m.19760 type:complete len:379 (+) Transcript_7412:21-1157(+)